MDARGSPAAGDNGFPLAEQPFSDAGMHPRLEAVVSSEKNKSRLRCTTIFCLP